MKPSTRSIVLAVGIGLFLLIPAGGRSQCNVTFTHQSSVGSTKYVTKSLSAPALCTLTFQNALFCFPAGPTTTAVFFASALTGATANPVCKWNCTCGTVTIDGSDGLPVELMDFSVE